MRRRRRERGETMFMPWRVTSHILEFPLILPPPSPSISGSLGIRLEAVVVPQFKFRGDNATLLCKYELEPNEELFSLKW